jgi:hypothetical protein
MTNFIQKVHGDVSFRLSNNKSTFTIADVNEKLNLFSEEPGQRKTLHSIHKNFNLYRNISA